jgi:hypothetical protein
MRLVEVTDKEGSYKIRSQIFCLPISISRRSWHRWQESVRAKNTTRPYKSQGVNICYESRENQIGIFSYIDLNYCLRTDP